MNISNISRVTIGALDSSIVHAELCEGDITLAYISLLECFSKDDETTYRTWIECVVEDPALDPFSNKEDYNEMMNRFFYNLSLADEVIKSIPTGEVLGDIDSSSYTTCDEECFELYDEAGRFIKKFKTWFKVKEDIYDSLKEIRANNILSLKNTNK